MAEDALARAREIAARLSGGITGGSDLGKRKNRWEDDGGASGPGLGSVQRKKIYIPVREHPDINFLGLIIGPKGASQKQMSESTGAKILIRGKGASKDGGSSNTGHPDDEDELHVFLEGSDDAVRKATAEIEKLFDPQYANRVKQQQLGAVGGGSSGGDGVYGPGSGDAYQIELRVPNNMVGLIIGKGGENIVRIQSQLGVHAQIAKEHEMLPGETLRSIVLKGTPSNVNEAKSRIDEIINAQIAKQSGISSDRGGDRSNSDRGRELDHAFVVKLPVPNDKVGIIIGRGGMTIKGIQERTRAHVQIPLTPDEENPQARTLSIGGDTKEAVDSAQMEIFMCLQTHAQQTAQNSASNALLMLVPDDKVGIIIGKGGATIKDIQNRNRVKVQIPPQPDAGSMPPMRTVSITGPPEAQPIAKYEIEMILAGTPLNGGDQYGGGRGGGGQYGGQYGGGQYGGQAQGQWGQQSAYGAQGSYYGAAQANPYAQQQAYGAAGGYYGAAAGAAAANPYAQTQAYGAVAQTAAAAEPAAAAPADHTAYYNDYWQYSTYYGEAAARVFYGAWSPPEGTPPPPGIVVATPEAAAANLAAAGTADASGAAAASATAQSDAAAAESTTATATAAAAATESAATEEAAAAADPEVAAAAWEAYKKQYAEWYEAHGKAAGADPNPPEM